MQGCQSGERCRGGDVVLATVHADFDEFGRPWHYTDADGVTSTTTYDLADRPVSRDDGKGITSYGYNGGAEHRGLPTSMSDSQAGGFALAQDNT